MKKWIQPTLTILSSTDLSIIIGAHARSLKCEKAHVR